MNPCKHKFKPRYDERYTTVVEQLALVAQSLSNAECEGSDTPYLKEKIYVHDICVKCGTVIQKRKIKSLREVEKMLCTKAGIDPDTVELCNPCVQCNFPGDCPKLGADVVMNGD